MKQILKDYVCADCLSEVEVIGYMPRKTRCTYCGLSIRIKKKSDKMEEIQNESN